MNRDLPVQELRLSLRIDAPPAAVLQALVDEAIVAAATGKPARIEAQEQGSFQILDGRIAGKVLRVADDHVALRVRMQVAGWPEGAESNVLIQVSPEGPSSRVLVDQRRIPSPLAIPCDQVWKDEVFTPLRRTLQPEIAHPRLWSPRKVPAA